MNGKIKRDNFSMKKIKLLKGGGIESVTIIELSIDGAFMEVERSQKTPIVPAPSLEGAVRSLKEKLLISCGYMDMKTLINSPEFKATKAQKDAAQKMIDIRMEKTNVTGVHVSGQDQNAGVIITGKIQAENGSNIAINSPRIRFSSSVFGFEEDLQGEVTSMEGELYEYLHEGKKAQLEVFGNEEQGPINEDKVIKDESVSGEREEPKGGKA